MNRVCILGQGAWGTAIATLLAANNQDVIVWCHDKEADAIQKNHLNNRYLPGITLSDRIYFTNEMREAITGATLIFEAIPVKFLRSVVQQAAIYTNVHQPWVVLSKGIEQETLALPSDIINQVLRYDARTAVLVGPGFARGLAGGEVTGFTLATRDQALGVAVQRVVSNHYCRPYRSSDIIGAQVCAALKNVIALGIGMFDGAGYGDNVKAFVFTRALRDVAMLVGAMGGKVETVYNLCGLGDMVLTAMGSGSRNLEVGKRLGRGETLDAILTATGYTPEGINTLHSLKVILEKYHIIAPILDMIYDMIVHKKNSAECLEYIMLMPLEIEC
jgi:glycerol-3-phosphate dehydrogenase (NAD(P)+)